MEDNKSLTQEDLNLYYYEKMIEKTYLRLNLKLVTRLKQELCLRRGK